MSAIDPSTVLQEARVATEQGRFDEALQKHIWFHDHALDHDESYYGVRLSFALGDWFRLGEEYPPARKALVEVRDRKTQTVLGEGGSFELFSDVQAINRVLGDTEQTLDLFEHIRQADPVVAVTCYSIAEDDLIADGRYQACSEFIPDPLASLDEHKRMRQLHLKFAAEDPEFDTPEFREYANSSFANGVNRLIEILQTVGRTAEADAVRAGADR